MSEDPAALPDPDIVSKLFFAEEENHTQAPRWASYPSLDMPSQHQLSYLWHHAESPWAEAILNPYGYRDQAPDNTMYYQSMSLSGSSSSSEEEHDNDDGNFPGRAQKTFFVEW